MKRSLSAVIAAVLFFLFVPHGAYADDMEDIVETFDYVFDELGFWHEFQYNESGVIMRTTREGIYGFSMLMSLGLSSDTINYDVWVRERKDAIAMCNLISGCFIASGLPVDNILYCVVSDEDHSVVMFAVYNGQLIFDALPHEVK